MLDVLRNWFDRYLSDEEAVLLAFIAISFLFIMVSMGNILAPFLTGIVLAYIMQGVVKRFTRYGVPHIAAFLLTFLIFLGGFIAFLVLVIPRVWRQMRSLFQELPELLEQARVTVEGLQATYPDFVSQEQIANWGEQLAQEAGQIGQWILSASLSGLPTLMAVMIYMMLVPIMVFFLLKDKDAILNWAFSFLPGKRPLLNQIAQEMDQQMSNYIRGKFVEFLVVGSVTWAFFAIYGLDYAALLAFLVGLSVMVPYIGAVAVTIPVVFIAYLQFGLGMPFLYLVLGYLIIQGLDGMILVPVLFSEANNLHPIAIILAVLIFGSWWGVWGVFFAIPLATLVKAIIYAWPNPGSRQLALDVNKTLEA